MSTFYVIQRDFFAALPNMLFLLNYKLTMTSILLQFHLQISLITRINPFSGCLQSLILFLYQKHTLILVVLLLMIATWKFMGTP